MLSQPHFSIVLVTFNSAHVIAEAIKSIAPDNQIIVVDNGSQDQSLQISKALGAETISVGRNIGFGSACNLGAKRATAEVLLFLNPDARLDSKALIKLQKAMQSLPEYAAFGLNIITDGRSFFRTSTRLLKSRWLVRTSQPNADCDTEMLSGAAFAIRKSVFDELGGFDEKIFLYFEDDDFCARLVKAGFRLRFLIGAKVEHAEGTSTIASPQLTHFKTYHFTKAMLYTMQKHRRPVWRNLRIIKEYFRLRFAQPNSRKHIVARARLDALLEKNE
ncbi:MAG: glycosyltransferase family 2 protein [Notoacmeibacter sp.]